MKLIAERIDWTVHGRKLLDGVSLAVETGETLRLCRTFGVYADILDDPIDHSRIMRFRNAV